MNIKRTCVCALVGALTIMGCVSVQTLEKDLKSNDPQKQAEATKNLTEIVTKGKSGFSTFSTKDRVWCAQHIMDKSEIIKVINQMSYSDLSGCNNLTPQEERVACEGFAHDDNAQILEVLLGNLGVNKTAVDLLVRADIIYKPKVYTVAEKYAKSYIRSIADLDELGRLMVEYNKYEPGRRGNELKAALAKHQSHTDVLPARMITLISGPNDVLKIINCYKAISSSIPEETLKTAVSRIKSQKEVIALYWAVDSKWLRGLIFKHVRDPESLSGIAIKEDDYRLGRDAVKKINDKAALVQIALFAEHIGVRNDARDKVNDEKAIVDELVKAINGNKLNNRDIAWHMLSINNATIALYNAVQDEALKQKVFDKLSGEDRKVLRGGNAAQGKELIEKSKGKAKETFELGGFYLGMDIADANRLIVYYFPEWSTKEGFEDDEKTVRAVWVPQQRRALCRADKNGKVWQFNFGKSILKKFYNFDVQNEHEWARAYSKANKVDLRYVEIEKEATVYEPMDMSYRVWFNQASYQYKHNAKAYRLIYFGEEKDFTIHGGLGGKIIKDIAASQFRYVGGDQGSLRVTVEND